MALDMNDEFFKNLFADDDDGLGDIFKDDTPAEEPAKEEPAAAPEEAPEEEVADIEMKTAEPEPAAEETAEPETPAEEPAPEVTEEPEAEAEEPIAEAQEPEEEVSEAVEETEEPEVKAEVETTDEEPAAEPAADDAGAGAGDEAVAGAEAPVEADAPAADEAAPAEPAEPAVEEPAVEMTVSKPKRKRRTKKEMKAAREEKAAEKAAEAKTEGVAAEAVAVAPEAPINEAFIDSLVLCLGPKYEAFRKDVSDRIASITVQPGMAPAVIANMIALNNELDNKLFNEGQGYIDAYLSLTDKETGLMTRIREMTMDTAEGSSSAKKRACMHALMNYTFPATGEKINLIQYANALKQATGFISNAKAYTKSTSVALATMMKVA